VVVLLRLPSSSSSSEEEEEEVSTSRVPLVPPVTVSWKSRAKGEGIGQMTWEIHYVSYHSNYQCIDNIPNPLTNVAKQRLYQNRRYC
jgi:hypothetical protein